MIKAIFVDPKNLAGIEKSGANYLMVTQSGLDKKIWERLKNLGMTLSISVNAFGPDGCPAAPLAQEKLFKKISAALDFKPSRIWLDHFRFDGHWEGLIYLRGMPQAQHHLGGVSEGVMVEIPEIHPPCQWCAGKNRVEVLSAIAKEVWDYVNGEVKIGYFAVPFKTEEIPQVVLGLGQDHKALGKIFDQISPMLYHRMINKPVSYISDYVRYLYILTGKPVLPIIQIKDMPDDLPDELSKEEIAATFNEARKKPSEGVAFFWWNHALEKNKTGIIANLFSSS